MKTLIKFEAKKFILISCLFIFSLNIFANGNSVVVTTYAGTGVAGSHDGDALTEATFGLPFGVGGLGMGICFDNEGNLLVADAGNDKLRKISPTGVVTTVAGSGIIGYLDGPANVARFDFPSDIAVDSIGNIYIADGNNNRIRKLDTAGIVSTFAGSGVCAHVDGIGTAASFCTPTGIEMDNEGNLIVADLNNSAIRKITLAGVVTTVKVVSAGAPVQVALDKEGNIFFTVFSNRIFKIDTNGIETLIAGGSPGFVDDTGAAAKFNLPWGIALDNDGNIYVGDQQNHRVRKIDTNNVVTTFAGTGVVGFKDGPADSAQFNHPAGLCHDASGNIFVADQGNSRIRKIAAVFEEQIIISGTVYTDFDSSNSLTPVDTAIGGRILKFTHITGDFYILNDSDGTYEFKGPEGDYIVTVVENAANVQTIPGFATSITLTSGQSSIANHFFLLPICDVTIDAVTNFAPFLGICPGVPFKICYSIKNSGTLTFVPGSIFTISFPNNISASDVFTTNNCGFTQFFKSKQFFLINLNDALKPGESCELCVEYTLDANFPFQTQPLAGQFFNAIPVHCFDGPTATDIGHLKFIEPLSCSFDPNDKLLVSPLGCGLLGKIERGLPLNYKVRFQNTGTASAINIVIKDTIDSDLNIETLQLISSSHFITKFEILPENIAVWTFENINLPDSSADIEGSKGFVEFKINHITNVPEGTEIKNTASIFFDLNLPVITNTTLNTIFDTPNPVADFSFERQCMTNAYDFFYIGGSTNVTAFWGFGSDAIPETSNDLNPESIIFATPGRKEVFLQVENEEGCISFLTDSIEVISVSCGINNEKVLVCHKPPGNNDNPQLLCISSNALETHLEHGDCIGHCTNSAAISKTSVTNNNNLTQQIKSIELSDLTQIYPNPYKNITTIEVRNLKDKEIKIEILNLLGKNILNIYNGYLNEEENNTTFEVEMTKFPASIYFVKIQTAGENTFYKLLKID